MEFFTTLLFLLNEMSPYLLLGFLIAGLLHSFVPAKMYSRHLGNPTMGSVVKAAAFGIPLPLCSCGVIPTAMSLRKDGASRGATVSFLIATPQTGVDSIAATYSLLGLPFALLRPVAALFTAILGGVATNRIAEANYCEPGTSECDSGCCSTKRQPNSFKGKIAEALRYGLFSMMQDIGKWLAAGLVLAALITMFIPDDFFSAYLSNPLIEMLVMLALAIPMYTCATGSIPVAMALMMKGMSPGAALVLLMAGPATNAASMFVVYKVLGMRTTATYIASIISGAILFGLAIDYLLPAQWFEVTRFSALHCAESSIGGISVFTAVFSVLMLFALGSRYFCKTDKTTNMRTFKITGMACNHCKANVINNISALDGVDSIDIDLQKGEAYITGDADDDLIINKVESLGYKCEKA